MLLKLKKILRVKNCFFVLEMENAPKKPEMSKVCKNTVDQCLIFFSSARDITGDWIASALLFSRMILGANTIR